VSTNGLSSVNAKVIAGLLTSEIDSTLVFLTTEASVTQESIHCIIVPGPIVT